MDLPICEHVKISGVRCGSTALHDQKFCHYHSAVHRLVPRVCILTRLDAPASHLLPNSQFDFPHLEDTAALQIGLSQLIHAISQDMIDHRRGRLMLLALQSAAASLRYAERLAESGQKASVPKKESAGVARNGTISRPPARRAGQR
jgi:hypothetical protein